MCGEHFQDRLQIRYINNKFIIDPTILAILT
jgi:hypothetical protein